jgi:hypothetical protein
VDERTFNRHLSPKPKEKIEADIAVAFARLVSEGSADGAKLEQLPENDLDFAWSQGDRKAKVEFTELVLAIPPFREEGQSAIIHYKPWGEKFCELVERKNGKRYSENLPIDLLVYTTHYAYHGNRFCIDLAAERLRHYNGGSAFDRIYYLEFAGDVSQLHLLKPYRAALAPNLRREYERQWYSPVNFANGTAVPGGTAFKMTLPSI